MSGYVYFIQADGLEFIKIGVARDVWARIGTLQIGCPTNLSLLGVVPHDDPVWLEAELHARFHNAHHRGEWFKPHKLVLHYIATNAVQLEKPAPKPMGPPPGTTKGRPAHNRTPPAPMDDVLIHSVTPGAPPLIAYKQMRGIPLKPKEQAWVDSQMAA